LAGELLALDLQVTELTIPFRALMAGETLAIGVQGVVHLIEQTPNGVGTDRDTQAWQLVADLLQAQACPEAPACHRVARRLIVEQLAQLAQDFRGLFRPAVVRHRLDAPVLGALGRSRLWRSAKLSHLCSDKLIHPLRAGSGGSSFQVVAFSK
jgi:hypothetical protein